MRSIRKLKNLARELWNTQTLLSIARDQRPIIVYSEDVASYSQFQGYLEELVERYHRAIVYVTSAPDDPLLSDHPGRMWVYFVNHTVPSFLGRVDSEIFITTMPDLNKLHIPRPKKESCCLYIFHSLNSIQEVYREGAFDHYDVFFCTGPHHKRELESHFRTYGLAMPVLHEVGYYKLDRVAQGYQLHSKRRVDRKTVLIAPSWGKSNLLKVAGMQLVERLLTLDVDVIIRPHPCFFLPIYPEGREIVNRIAHRFDNRSNVVIERNINSEESFYEADLMISDFSGAAFEYSLGTLRPVLFIDVPRKTINPNWHRLGQPTFEDTMRYEVGRVVSPEEVATIDRNVTEMLEEQDAYRQRLEELRNRIIYNFGDSAEVGAQIIDDMLK